MQYVFFEKDIYGVHTMGSMAKLGNFRLIFVL